MKPEVRKLLLYIAQEMEPEPMSGLFVPGGIWHVECRWLLDTIRQVFCLTAEEIASVVDY